MRVYAARVESMTPKREESLTALLDKDRQNKVRQISHDVARSRSIYAGLLLRYAYLMAGGTDFLSVRVMMGEHGKPYLAGHADFHYSLSHSGDWVLCAAGESEVGADIQQLRPYRGGVAERFFHEKEYARLEKIKDAEEKKREFYRMWTAKEAFAKLTGRGIGAGMDRYVTDGQYRQVQPLEMGGTAFLKLYETIPGYLAAISSYRDDFPKELELMRDDWLRMEDTADGKR